MGPFFGGRGDDLTDTAHRLGVGTHHTENTHIVQNILYMDAGKASILCSCEPVAAMVFGICFFGEIPTVLSITGLIIVLVALAMLVLPEKKTMQKNEKSD